jgi:hypothetical protein
MKEIKEKFLEATKIDSPELAPNHSDQSWSGIITHAQQFRELYSCGSNVPAILKLLI